MDKGAAANICQPVAFTDLSMVGWMRLALATAALSAMLVDADGMTGDLHVARLVIGGYALYSLCLILMSRHVPSLFQSKTVHWLDVFWSALIVFSTNGSSSFFFLFFFFAIICASFRWGFQEGARIAMASAGLYALTVLAGAPDTEVARIVLRTSLLLTLGCMIAYWGGYEVTQKRRLVLLRNVSQVSNPRFGIDRTISCVLEETCAYFRARSCLVVVRDRESGIWSIRTAMGARAGSGQHPDFISAELAEQFMAFGPDRSVIVDKPRLPLLALGRLEHTCQSHDLETGQWTQLCSTLAAPVVAILECRSFISASLPLRKGEGRIYVIADNLDFQQTDALFLNDIATLAFPVIETIELLDRLASSAATTEREKIACDLHDSTIQPFIGLKYGLNALRNKASFDNPLLDDIDRLISTATEVIADLRRYTGILKATTSDTEPLFMNALRKQVAQVRDIYAIDIAISVDRVCDLNDRLAAEVIQIVCEGISNIRKHTSARCGQVCISMENETLTIMINNAGPAGGEQEPAFAPRSISERAAALGGVVRVVSDPHAGTTVEVNIPI